MASDSIGVIRGAETGHIYAIVNPDDDSELDNPQLMLLRHTTGYNEALVMIKLPRDQYMKCLSQEDLWTLVGAISDWAVDPDNP